MLRISFLRVAMSCFPQFIRISCVSSLKVFYVYFEFIVHLKGEEREEAIQSFHTFSNAFNSFSPLLAFLKNVFKNYLFYDTFCLHSAEVVPAMRGDARFPQQHIFPKLH